MITPIYLIETANTPDSASSKQYEGRRLIQGESRTSPFAEREPNEK